MNFLFVAGEFQFHNVKISCLWYSPEYVDLMYRYNTVLLSHLSIKEQSQSYCSLLNFF